MNNQRNSFNSETSEDKIRAMLYIGFVKNLHGFNNKILSKIADTIAKLNLPYFQDLAENSSKRHALYTIIRSEFNDIQIAENDEILSNKLQVILDSIQNGTYGNKETTFENESNEDKLIRMIAEGLLREVKELGNKIPFKIAELIIGLAIPYFQDLHTNRDKRYKLYNAIRINLKNIQDSEDVNALKLVLEKICTDIENNLYNI